MPAGGRQPGSGHPTAHATALKKEGKASAAAVEQRVLHPEYDALLDAALFLAKGQQVSGCLRCFEVAARCKCHKIDLGKIYLVKPDKDMLRLLVEKIGGRATQAPQVASDTTITVVPRFERPPMPGLKVPVPDDDEEAA